MIISAETRKYIVLSRFGARRVCVTGSLVAGAGLLLASYTASVTQLLVTYSLVTGLGFGLMYIPGVVAAQVTRPPPRPRADI